MKYPAYSVIPFCYDEAAPGYVGYVTFKLRRKDYSIPITFTKKDLRQPEDQLAGLFSDLLVNSVNAAHDLVDDILKRGDFKDVKR